MKLKIFSFLTVFFAMQFAASAQTDIAGTYNGTMTVNVVIPNPDVVNLPDQNIIITDEESGSAKLSILNFSFMRFNLGNLEISDISTVTTGAVTTLSKDVMSPGPVIEGLGVATLIALNPTSINAGALSLDLSVYLDYPGLPLEAANVANVTFSGNLQTGIFSPKAGQIAVYPTVATDNITVTGFENEAYAIFNQSGILVRNGKLNTQIISVSDLNAGVYILKINDASTVFIKK